MIRYTTYLILAACGMAAPGAVAQQPGQGPQGQPRATASPSVIAPQHDPYSANAYDGTSYSYGPYAGGEYDATGGQIGAGTGGDSASAAAPSGSGSARALEVILRASGVPNQHGQVAWPGSLRLVRADSQLQQLEAQLQLAAEQVTAGGANPQLLDEIRLNVEGLRQVLLVDQAGRHILTRAEYEDTDYFLQKLEYAPKILAASAPAARSEAPAR